MRFYTNFFKLGSNVVVIENDHGVKKIRKIDYRPTLYLPTKKDSEYKTVFGQNVEPINPGNINETWEFIKRYRDVENFKFFGSTKFEYTCINENYTTDHDSSLIKIANIDIEVDSEDGFPEPALAAEEVTAITMSVTHRGKREVYVFASKEYTGENKNIHYKNCRDEKMLLASFMNFFKRVNPDIITGWNAQFFDIPYLYNRIPKVIDERYVKYFSPVGVVKTREVYNMNRLQMMCEIRGVAILDYIELYKKFVKDPRESYKLGYIAFVELGETKLDYEEEENLRKLYRVNFNKFIDYNVKDVYLVDKLEDKLKLIELAIVIAHDSKVNYVDVMTSVKLWDILIHNYLMDRKLVVPQNKDSNKDASFAGGFVKDPMVGLHKWVLSFDLDSLYPHLIMQYNISPEMLIEGSKVPVDIDAIISREFKSEHEGKSLAANGYLFDNSKRGFLAEMMDTMYSDRKSYKNRALKAEAELQEINRLLAEA